MIIDNIVDNENNNINNTNRLVTVSKLKKISKKICIFAIFFIQIYYASYKLYINNTDFAKLYRKNNLFEESSDLKDNYLNIHRDLEFNNRTNESSGLKNIIDELNNKYFLILNLSSNVYIGNWTNLSFRNDSFFDKDIEEGIAEFVFRKNKPHDKSVKTNSFKMDIYLREGKYSDKEIRINFTFPFNNDINKYLKNNGESIIITNNEIFFNYIKINYHINKKMERVLHGDIAIILTKKDYLHSSSFKQIKFSPYNNVKLIITSKDLNVTIDSKIENEDSLIEQVKLYSFILSFFGLIEIYYTSKLIIKINLQNEMANKISIITIEINCCFKLVICIFHFLLSISIVDEDISYQFGIIAIIYFFSFIGFEVKLFLLIFNIRNIGGNREYYRRRLFLLYLIFYISFSFIVFNIKKLITSYNIILSVYILYWLSQILYSLIKNERPPMSRLYIFWHSLSKIFMPIYIKGIDGNFFNFKPSYLKVGLIVGIVLLESIILFLQKSLGSRVIIPKKYRKPNQAFDYYKNRINVEKHISQNPICVICLENLMVDVDENLNKIKKKKKHKTCFDKIFKILYLDVLNDKIKKWINLISGKNLKKKYMITPCDHVYHSVCLEKWMKQKNECPYCRREIPSID